VCVCLISISLNLGLISSVIAGSVSVSSRYGTLDSTTQRRVGAGSVEIISLGILEPGTKYEIEISSDNRVYPDISAFVVDRENLDAFRSAQRFTGVGFSKRSAPYQITGSVSNISDYYLVIDNKYSVVVTKLVTAKILMNRQLSEEQINAIQRKIELLMQQALRDYDIPDFDVNVQPYGQVNAMSATKSGNITLCTEMMSKTLKKSGAFFGIFFHEIGHSALNLWRLPNASNEETVDEFAVQLLIRAGNGEALVREFADYFSSMEPWIEAKFIIERGGKHPLSPQRIRNITEAARNPVELTERWNKQLYPYYKREALERIIQNPRKYDSVPLAIAEIKRR
jgi:hypothetical protein